jgi:hypothetical protein
MPIEEQFAQDLAAGTLYMQWPFYLSLFIVTAVGSFIGAWVKERVRGDVSKAVWLAQESWKEKYRLYTLAITASEEMTAALWSIVTDARTLTQMSPTEHSTEADGLRMFPEHREFLDAETRALEKLLSAHVGIELM